MLCMIEFVHVYLKYIKDYYTLYDINLKINTNTILIGECFDGTNSILRLISKIDKKYVGEIFIDGLNLTKIKDNELNVAYVSEDAYLFKNKSVFDNLYYPLKIRKIKKNEAKNLINNYLKKFDINFSVKKIKDLSISEKKIITLLRACIRKPKYLLLEHFFDNLDEKFYQLANDIINEFKKDLIIIACENSDINQISLYDAKRVNLENGSIKK